jgi:hypothetical protein
MTFFASFPKFSSMSLPTLALMAGCLSGLAACSEANESPRTPSGEGQEAQGDVQVHPTSTLRPSSYNDPQIPSGKGPWFDGWYNRVTDEDGKRSVAVIAAFFKPQGEAYDASKGMPGYLAVLVSEGNGAPTKSYEVFPKNILVRSHGEPAQGKPDFFSPSNFEWSAPGYGSVTHNQVDIKIPGQVEVRMDMSSRLPFGYMTPAAGPEGFLAMLPLPLHWHVESLSSKTTYQWTTYGSGGTTESRVYGVGQAHQEKNWGEAFPSAWLWGQGIQKGNRSQFVFGGGRVSVGPVSIEPYLAAFRSPKANVTMSPDRPLYIDKEFDACAGQLKMTIKGPTRTLRIEASAPPASFGPVSIPTKNGFLANAGEESFSAHYRVQSFVHDPVLGLFGKDRLEDEQEFDNAALEFGADYHCVRP